MASQGVQRRTQSCVPVAVAQVLACKTPQFRIYDVPVQIIHLVGIIRNIKVDFCEATCEIHDHSGAIKGILRSETDSEVAAKFSGIREESYAKIFGTVRVEDGVRLVLILKMFPIDDLNVITNHMLHVCCFTLEAEAERNRLLASANTSGAALADSLAMSVDGDDETPTGTVSLSNFQKLIFDIVKSEHTDVGISKRNILRQFPSYQGHEVNQALDFLINQGIIYYSVDQEHLKAATF